MGKQWCRQCHNSAQDSSTTKRPFELIDKTATNCAKCQGTLDKNGYCAAWDDCIFGEHAPIQSFVENEEGAPKIELKALPKSICVGTLYVYMYNLGIMWLKLSLLIFIVLIFALALLGLLLSKMMTEERIIKPFNNIANMMERWYYKQQRAFMQIDIFLEKLLFS